MYFEKQPAINIKYTGTCDTATLTCDGNNLYTWINGAIGLSLSYDLYPHVADLVAKINGTTNYHATLSTTTYEIPITNEQHDVTSTPPYQTRLNYPPKSGTLYVQGFTEVSDSPGRGQFTCDYSTGLLTFSSNDAGNVFAATYTGLAPADLSSLESKYLEIRNNKQINIKIAADDHTHTYPPAIVTYQRKITTVKDVKEHLTGIGLGSISDEFIEKHIDISITHIENRTRLYLREFVIKCESTPYGLNIQEGVNCDRTEPPYDGTDTNYLKLRYEPLIQIQRVELVYLGNLVRSYPFEWIQTNKFRSEIRIVPSTGSFHLMGIYSGSYLFHSFFPQSTSMFGHFLPWIQVDYTAGFKFGSEPEDLRHAVELNTAIDVLRIADGVFMPGVASHSTDGVSDTFTRSAQTSMFGNRIKEYEAELEAILRPWKRIRMVGI